MWDTCFVYHNGMCQLDIVEMHMGYDTMRFCGIMQHAHNIMYITDPLLQRPGEFLFLHRRCLLISSYDSPFIRLAPL